RNAGHGGVPRAGVVRERAQCGDFCGGPVGLFFGIALHGADEDEQALIDLSGDFSIDCDGGGKDALNEGSHGWGLCVGGLKSWVKSPPSRALLGSFGPKLFPAIRAELSWPSRLKSLHRSDFPCGRL